MKPKNFLSSLFIGGLTFFLAAEVLAAPVLSEAAISKPKNDGNGPASIAKAIDSPSERPYVTQDVYSFAKDDTLLLTLRVRQPAPFTTEEIAIAMSLNAYLREQGNLLYNLKARLDGDALALYEAWRGGQTNPVGYNMGYTRGKCPAETANPGYGCVISSEMKESPRTISFVSTFKRFTDGANATLDTYAATFDRESGVRLSLGEALGDDAVDRIARYLQKYLPNSPHKGSLRSDYNGHLYDFCYNERGDGWYLAGENIVIIYPTASVTKAGEVIVVIPQKKIFAA